MIEAQILGPAPTTDPQAQTEGYLFLAKTDALSPGAALVAWLAVPGQARSGVIVPRDAVLRHEGETFVYLQTVADEFQRKAVELERPVGNGWFSDKDLRPQEKVVVVGAQQLLSEELKAREGGE
jgi:multidrug efflux pump subunit AcrA (membrane-fusion protein)